MNKRKKARKGPAKPRSRGGRPRKEGARYPSGKLKPAGPNARVIEQRKALMGSGKLDKATCPIDLATAKGWLTEAEHRIAQALASLFAQSGIGPRSSGTQRLGEVDESLGFAVINWRDMAGEDLEALWDRVFDKAEGSGETASARALELWNKASAAMTPEQRNEVFLVCIMESWPQWVIQRVNGHTDTKWERKRDLLTAGLEAAGNALKPKKKPAPVKPARPITIEPRAALQGRKVAETTLYVDPTGVQVLEVVRVTRRS